MPSRKDTEGINMQDKIKNSEDNNMEESVFIQNIESINTQFDIIKGYTIINGFAFTSLTYPYNIHDAIIIKCKGISDCVLPEYNIPFHTIEEYIEIIRKESIEKAIIILDNISFITKCPSLKYFDIIPSNQAGDNFDFSPLYELSEIKSLQCQNNYGDRGQYLSEIDYSKMNGLQSLSVNVNKKTLNFNIIPTLKSFLIGGLCGKNYDLTDLFGSKNIDTIMLMQCKMRSLNGIETTGKLQCLYLYYNRSLKDISALCKVKKTLKALRIENCPKIEDFSVLGELENLELLELTGSNVLPNLDFIKTMKNLKTFICNMNVLDGDLTPCLNLSYVYVEPIRRHYNLKDADLPKGEYVRGNENIEEWRRLE